ncbi:MAG TPA: alpha/beta fold hydrolase [Rhodopila sp.]|nr:alpha/beta fold hydrolase [Rhodopila sp.]
MADRRPGQRRVRLVLLPHAGGGANTYRQWPGMMPSGVDVRPVQLPGRERRFSEPPIARMDALLDALVPALLPLLDLPFALFGHSMGSCIAHALALRLGDLGLPKPCLLIASGRDAPHLPRRKRILHTLAEPEFLEELRCLNGTPAEVLENRELLDLVMPMLRADFALVEEYRPGPGRLECPIVVLGGETDAETTPEGLAAWSARTTAPTRVVMLPGGHFFTETARAEVVNVVASALHPYGRDN